MRSDIQNDDIFLNQVDGVNALASRITQGGIQAIQCPACSESPNRPALETYHSASLYECPGCDLHFWHPVTMPDAAWHEQTYQTRDQTALPLEPGHRFFLSDQKPPEMDVCSTSVAARGKFSCRRTRFRIRSYGRGTQSQRGSICARNLRPL